MYEATGIIECIVYCVVMVWATFGLLFHNDCDREYLGLNDKENKE